MEAPKSMLLWTARIPKKGTNIWSAKFVRVFRLNRWLTYLILAPAIVATVFLTIFFFAVSLALFAVIFGVIGVALMLALATAR